MSEVGKLTGKKTAGKTPQRETVLRELPLWSSTNQPSPEAKSRGAKKKRALRDLMQICTGSTFNDAQKVSFQKNAALYFGIPESKITIEMMMDFRQIEKAIMKADTYAYNSLKEWAYGSPKQLIQNQLVDENGNPVKPDPLSPSANRLSIELIMRKPVIDVTSEDV